MMIEIESNAPILVSGCLAGITCNYLGEATPHPRVVELVKEGRAIPICPEQLGGLPTPRTPAEQIGDNVVTKNGVDVTDEFNRGAELVLNIARQVGCELAILRARSPSCGKGRVYDGRFTGNLVAGNGVTAEILTRNSINVLSEEEI